MTLDEIKTTALFNIDRAAASSRSRILTTGWGQSLVYRAKREEAAACAADPAPAASDYPLLAAEVGITAADLTSVATAVLSADHATRLDLGAIEAIRLAAKRDIGLAADSNAVDSVMEALIWP